MREQRPMAMNPGTMSGATEQAKALLQSILDRAERISTDAQKKERLATVECKACFYTRPRMGSAAMTDRRCMCCDEMQHYGSGNTDVLCAPCAVKSQLCKHCGADIELRTRRRNWPRAYAEQLAERPDPNVNAPLSESPSVGRPGNRKTLQTREIRSVMVLGVAEKPPK